MQLRAHGLDPARLKTLAKACKQRCRQSRAQLFINGDIALAQALGCGVHLRSAQLSVLRERPLPEGLPVAASCHDAAELRQAERLDVDFAVLGPVRATPSHPERAALGWRQFTALRESVSLPIYALGGMARADVATARQHGAQGVAAIRGLWPDFPTTGIR